MIQSQLHNYEKHLSKFGRGKVKETKGHAKCTITGMKIPHHK